MPHPNLFIVGAMKSGTTLLHSLLNRHPDIFMSETKEPCHFSRRKNWERGEDEYLALFDKAGEAAAIGESSTEYAKLPVFQGVPERIHRFAPRARILYIMRDPIRRAVSHYWFNWRIHDERRAPEEAFRKDPKYVQFGDYAMQLRPYLGTFGRDRVRCLTLEELTGEPEQELTRLFEWLGVSSDVAPSEFERVNPTPDSVPDGDSSESARKISRSPLWKAAGPLVPAVLRRVARNLLFKQTRRSDVSFDAGIGELRPVFHEKVRELSLLLNRAFPRWDKVG